MQRRVAVAQSLRPNGPGYGRELIYARNYKELLTFLDTLTYGERSTPGLRETKQAWNQKLVHAPWHRAMGFREPAQHGSSEPSDPDGTQRGR